MLRTAPGRVKWSINGVYIILGMNVRSMKQGKLDVVKKEICCYSVAQPCPTQKGDSKSKRCYFSHVTQTL